MNMINNAILIALKAHKNQFDKGSMPYINHPGFVALNMQTDTEKTVALLHDVLEDSDYTEEMLIEEGIPESAVKSVLALTRKKDEEYSSYIKRLSKDPIAKKVKIADLKHNMDLSRIKNPNEEDIKRKEKYEKALEFLCSVD